MDKRSHGKSQQKKLKNLKVNLNLVTLNQGSTGDFLFKHFTRTVCHVRYSQSCK